MVTTLTTCGVNESGALLKESMSIRPEAIGKIIMFAGNTAPEGTLYCNGAAISRTTYSELFAAIGTTYGAGDGSTTFNVPDLRGRWIVGANETHAVASDITEGVPEITGRLDTLTGTGAWLIRTAAGVFRKTDNENTSGESGSELQSVKNTYRTNSVYFSASASNAIYGAQNHVTPASVALLPCIIYE